MNEYQIIITPQADEELEDIAFFIALDNPLANKRFVTKLVTVFFSFRSTKAVSSYTKIAESQLAKLRSKHKKI